MAHNSRTDFVITMLVIFLVIYATGKLSVDYLIQLKYKSF